MNKFMERLTAGLLFGGLVAATASAGIVKISMPPTMTPETFFTMTDTVYGQTQYLTELKETVVVSTTAVMYYGSFFTWLEETGTDGHIMGPSYNYVPIAEEPVGDQFYWSRGCKCGQFRFTITVDPTVKPGYESLDVIRSRSRPSSGYIAINCTA